MLPFLAGLTQFFAETKGVSVLAYFGEDPESSTDPAVVSFMKQALRYNGIGFGCIDSNEVARLLPGGIEKEEAALFLDGKWPDWLRALEPIAAVADIGKAETGLSTWLQSNFPGRNLEQEQEATEVEDGLSNWPGATSGGHGEL